MNENKNRRTAKITLITIVAVLTIIMASTALALTISTPEKITGKPGEEITIPITITGSNGTITLTRTPEIGTITSTNNTHKEFKWTATYETGETHKKITFKAEDENNQTATNQVTIAKPPEISLETSGGQIHENKYNIKLQTDMQATCKYDLTDKKYTEKQYTLKEEENNHSGTTPSLGQGTHTIHITCKSELGAEAKTKIPLEVNLRPTAEIRLNPRPPLRAGIVKVEVIASEDLITTPELRYYFNDDTTPRSITLTGSGNRWEGYIVIQETDKKRIGTFEFKGIDKTNFEGTEITDGKIFIVDNSNPVQVASINAEIERYRIKLEWRYLDEENHGIKEYRIYRKKSRGGVEYIDYYATTSESHYYDTDVEYGEAYYYKVSAVNHAGREGELSREVAVTFIPSTDSEATPPKDAELSPILRTMLSNHISRVDRILMDISSAETQLQRATGREKIDAIQDLEILAKITSSKNKLNSIKNELEKLKERSLSEEEFDIAVKAFMDEAEQALKNTPLDIEIKDSISYQEFTDDDKARKAIEEYFLTEGLNIDEIQTRNLINNIIKMQDQFLIETTIIKAEIKYEEETKTYTIAKKRVSSQETITNAEILELIPIELGTATEITFVERPEIIRQNPLVKWTAERLGTKTITYYVEKDADTSLFRNTKTTIVSGEDIEQKRNIITGRATQEAEETEGRHPLFIPLIIGIFLVLLLTTYYVRYSSSETTISMPRIITRIKNKIKDNNMRIMPKKKNDSHRKLDIDPHEHGITRKPTAETAPKLEEQRIKQEIHAPETPRKENELEEVRQVLSTIKNLCEELHEKTTANETTKKTMRKKIKKPKITKAPEEKAFILRNGQKLKDLKELKESLKYIDEETFKHHVNQERHDFSEWIHYVFKDESLARRIRNSKTRKEIIRKIRH